MPHTVSPRPLTAEPGFNPRPVNAGFMVDKVALRYFQRIGLFPFYPVSVIQTMRHSHSFVYH